MLLAYYAGPTLYAAHAENFLTKQIIQTISYGQNNYVSLFYKQNLNI
jgi:hypothetical protein